MMTTASLDNVKNITQNKRYKKDDWAEVRTVLEERLEQLADLDGATKRTEYYQREQLARWVETAMEKSGNKCDAIDLLKREIPFTHCYPQLVTALLSAREREEARSGQTVLIASPWITMKAINDDDLAMLVTAAVGQRGAQVWVVVDRELSTRRPEHRGREALEILRQAGATICAVNNMHNKTLISGPSEITEGSFNWLSAQRQRGDRFIRYEASWRIAGASAAGAVQSALDEFAKLGVPLCVSGTAELIAT